MSGPGRPFLRAGERVKQARQEGRAPGVVLEDLLVPGASSGVQVEDLHRKVEAGERVTPAEGLWLLTEAPLIELGEVARTWRFRHNPARRVTFVIDTNPN